MKTRQAAAQPDAQHAANKDVSRSSHVNGVGRPLADRTQQEMETRFGHSFSEVRIHANEASAGTARLLGARAYTVGNHISFADKSYNPDSQSGRALLAHELTHVVQQRQGGPQPDRPHEREATNAAHESTYGNNQISVQQASGIGLAFSVDDWLEGSRNITQLSYSEVVKDIDEINQWLARQTTSTPESAHLEEALQELVAEKSRKEKRARSRKGKKRRPKQDDATQELQKPRILREQTSVQYESAEEVNQEVDLIMAWLANERVSRRDRRILQAELEQLAPQFDQGRAEELEQRRMNRLQSALTASNQDDAAASLLHISRVLQNLSPDPTMDGVFLIFHEGEQVRISAAQVDQLRKEMAAHFRKGQYNVRQKMESGFSRYNSQDEINKEHRIISAIAGWLGDSDDPKKTMEETRDVVVQLLARVEEEVAEGDFPRAARLIAAAENLANMVYEAGLAFNESHIRGAGLAVKGLEFTRNVSFAIAGSVAAVVAAPVVAAGAAGLASGAGLTGAGAAVATTVGTTVGTGAVVGTGSAIVRGGSAGAGELIAGNSLANVGEAAWREGKTGAREGVVAGLTGGAANSLGTTFGVAKEGLKLTSQLGRRAAAEGTADFIGGTADALLQDKGLGESLVAGTKNAAFGAPGSVVGAVVKGPVRRAVAETVTSSGTAFGATVASGGTIEEGFTSGSIAAVSSIAVRRAAANTKPSTKAEARAFETGAKAGSQAKGLGRKVRSTTAAIMIGTADALPATTIPGGSVGNLPKQTQIVQVDAAPPRTNVQAEAAQVGTTTSKASSLELDTEPRQFTPVTHNEIDLGPTPNTRSLELDTGPRQSTPVAHNEIDLGPTPDTSGLKTYTGGKPVDQIPGVRRQRPGFGDPSTESSGTFQRSGVHFNELNAAEISAGVRVDYDPIAGRPRRVQFRIDAEAANRRPVTDRTFVQDPSTEGAQPRDSSFTNTGLDRGHLIQREGVRGNADVEAAVDQLTAIVPMTPALNRGRGSYWRASESRAMQWAERYGSVTVEVEPIYASNPPRLRDGTPVPRAIRRRIIGPDGQVLEDSSHLNQ